METKLLNKDEMLKDKDRITSLFDNYFNKIYPGKKKVEGSEYFNLVADNIGNSMELISFGKAGFILMEIGYSESRDRKEAIVRNIFNDDRSVDMEKVKDIPEQIARQKGATTLLFYSDKPMVTYRWLKKNGVDFIYGVLKKELN